MWAHAHTPTVARHTGLGWSKDGGGRGGAHGPFPLADPKVASGHEDSFAGSSPRPPAPSSNPSPRRPVIPRSWRLTSSTWNGREAAADCLLSLSGESAVQPQLWVWVNPSLVCPIPGQVSFPPAGPQALPADPQLCLLEEQLRSPAASQAEEEGADASRAEQALLLQTEDAQGERTATPWKAKALRSRGRKLKRAQGGWARPPLNYCILISLALSSSVDGTLTVQEIYQFTRQHFPFFRTAPEGWKNTVRHNLCFSSSFEKTTDFVCLEGNRKSRLWRLTPEGRRRFQEEMQVLTEEAMGLVHQSMDQPELMRSLFGL